MLAFEAMNAFLEAETIDLFRIVHGEQRFTYERPVVPGDVLSATLSVADLRQIAGNDIIGTTSEVTDAAARWSAQPSRRWCTGAGRMSLPTSFTFTRADLVRYAEASGDDNPIHQDEGWPAASGCPA